MRLHSIPPFKAHLLFLMLGGFFILASMPSTAFASNEAPPVTAIIDIDNRPVSLVVNDGQSCLQAIANRINNLKALTQDTFTVTNVVAQCFDSKGQLFASGRCGVRSGSGQITRLCVPVMQ